MRSDGSATVVGSGPNGLTAAVVLAAAGVHVTVLEARDTIGGGTRTEPLTLPGFLHDVCSAFHPLGAASPAFAGLPLAGHGLEWVKPQIQLAHPLADGSAAALWHSLDDTEERLGPDGRRWGRLAGRIAERWPSLGDQITAPLIAIPDRPFELLTMAPGALPATVLARRFSGARTRALFAGIAAHSMLRLTSPMTSATGLILGALAHVEGWPVARGGSASITTALARHFESLGGEIVTGHPVQTRADLPDTEVVLWNTTPTTLIDVYGGAVPPSMRRWIRRYRYGVGSYKVDYALDGPIPWTAEECHSAGTVHVGGTIEEIAAAEATVVGGGVPDRPFVLVGQQSLVDATRAPEGKHTAWAYCHVPSGYRGSVLAQIEAQIERFAPGFRDLVLARHVMGTRDLEDRNANYRGGDIGAGATTMRQLIARPRFSPTPYRTAIPGVYLCSASTPPGPGVHGMSGYHAAHLAIRDHFS